MSNVERAGAAYEAVLVDKVTENVKAIVKSLDILKQAFKDLDPHAKDLNRELNGVAAAMREAQRERTAPNVFKQIGAQLQRMTGIVSTATQAIGQALIHIGNQARNAGLALTGMFAAATYSIYSTVRAAGDATETLNAFNAVFRENAAEVDDWAKQYSKSIGRSLSETRRGLTTFQSFFVGMGIGANEAAGLSEAMQALAVDFASFFNLSDEEAQRRFLGGLAGQSENLLRFGINVQDASLSQTKFAQAIGKTADQMNQFEKTQARIEVITDTMEDLNAAGDAFRTRFELANMLKRLGAGFRTLKESMGALIEGPARDIAAIFTGIFTTFKLTADGMKGMLGALAAIGMVGGTLLVLGTAIAALGPPVIALGTVLASFLGTVAFLTANPILIPPAMIAGVATLTAGMLTLKGVIESDFTEAFLTAKIGFLEFTNTALDGISGIAAAIRTEDWESAWEIFRLTAKLAFLDLAEALKDALFKAITEVGDQIMDTFSPENLFAGDGGASGPFWVNLIPDFHTNQLLFEEFGRQFSDMLGSATRRRLQNAIKEAKAAAAELEDDEGGKGQSTLDKLRESLKRLQGLSAPEEKASLDEHLEFGDPDPRLKDFPIGFGDVKEEMQRFKHAFQSVMGSGAQFASNVGAYAPVMTPLERIGEEQVNIAKQQLDQDKKMAAALESIEDSLPGTFL